MEQFAASSRFLIVSLVLIFNSATTALASLSHRENYTVYVQRSRSECRYVCGYYPWSSSERFPSHVLCRHNLDRKPCRHFCVTKYESVSEIRTRCEANWTGSDCDILVCSNCSNGTDCSHLDNCTDVDECGAGTSGCSQLCNNSIGSYTCGCNPGYRLAPDRKACYDVNECSTRRSGCAQLCNNTIGSFTCGCNPGYRLGPNGKSCYDVNECSTRTSGCAQLCSNSIGSFTCGCNAGYGLAPNGKSCYDINECSTKRSGCAQLCYNSFGSYTCGCHPGYRLAQDGKSCIGHGVTERP